MEHILTTKTRKPPAAEQPEMDVIQGSPHRIAFYIHDVSRMRKTLIDQILTPHGITRSQWWVLANLARHSNRTLSQVELGRLLDMKKVSVGELVTRLEAAGYVAREPSPKDGRAKLVHLTDKGRDALQAMTDLVFPTNEKIHQGITAEDLDVATRVLRQMKNNLRDMFEEQDD